MELEGKKEALEDLKAMLGNNFKAVDRILAIQCEVVKVTGDISNVLSAEYELYKAVDRINAKGLINFLVNKLELVEVRDDRDEDGSITYYFKLECPSRMLAVELMIAWKDNR